MQVRFTERARWQYTRAPSEVQGAFDRKLEFLAKNLRHPSLHAKKYDEANDIWQVRVSKGWRFYVEIRGDTYLILFLIPHPK